jgi:hypothetical protein
MRGLPRLWIRQFCDESVLNPQSDNAPVGESTMRAKLSSLETALCGIGFPARAE